MSFNYVSNLIKIDMPTKYHDIKNCLYINFLKTSQMEVPSSNIIDTFS
jgi:hypothetical protein